MLQTNQGDSKTTWKTLKQLLPKCTDGGITSLDINGTLITDFKQICNTFNQFFIDTSTRLAEAIRSVNMSALDYLKRTVRKPTKCFSFKTVNSNEVLKLINRIPNGKATGIDNIQIRLLKACAPAIVDSLTYILNLSLQLGVFPTEWKKARVSPIFKKGSKTDPGNFRPVSVLPVVSKIIERIAHKQLYEYLTEHKLLCIEQSGFRRRHSCQSSLHRLTEHFYDDLHKGKVIGMITVDLRKAFDTVDNQILVNKLQHYGIE